MDRDDVSERRGVIVLAAYRPQEELFRRQLLSIRSQTVREWTCIVTADGGLDDIARQMADAVGDDPRFQLVGGERLGFVGNFERGLRHVDEDAEWVALSDQDDEWYPQKLQLLLPHLANVAVVSGQARLVEHPSGKVQGVTERRNVDAPGLILNNQFTGSLMIFRREILRIALPVPDASTRASAHDHWLAVVGAHLGGARVLDDIVQDYVQHDSNVFGDPGRRGGSFLASVRNARSFAQRYQGSSSPAALLRMTFDAFVGWRQLMVETLAGRIDRTETLDRSLRMFGRDRRLIRLVPRLRQAIRRGEVPRVFAAHYVASWVSGALTGGRRRMPPAT